MRPYHAGRAAGVQGWHLAGWGTIGASYRVEYPAPRFNPIKIVLILNNPVNPVYVLAARYGLSVRPAAD